jgi:hypothetical protein
MLEQTADTRIDPIRVADELLAAVEASLARLRLYDESAASRRPAAGRWSRKEILGHLIDSAANNHQRFVRGQEADPRMLPPYAQEHWVRVQAYQDAPWDELIDLWGLYNRHLSRVVRLLPAATLAVQVRIGANEPVTVGYLAEDYVAHLKHHLRQIDEI